MALLVEDIPTHVMHGKSVMFTHDLFCAAQKRDPPLPHSLPKQAVVMDEFWEDTLETSEDREPSLPGEALECLEELEGLEELEDVQSHGKRPQKSSDDCELLDPRDILDGCDPFDVLEPCELLLPSDPFEDFIEDATELCLLVDTVEEAPDFDDA